MGAYVLLFGLGLLVAGVAALHAVQQQILRPSAQDGALIVLDERPVPFDVQFSLNFASASESDMTLLTVVDPVINVGSEPIEPPGGALSIEQVIQLMEHERPEAAIREIRVRREQGMVIYEVDFSDNLRLRMDATSGQMILLDSINSRSLPPPHQRVQGLTASTTLLSAVALAQERYPQATFKDAKLEIHAGLLVYKVKFNGGINAFVDANTGEHLFSSLPHRQYDTTSLTITPEDVVSVVLAAYPNVTIHEWKVKFEMGTIVYEVKLSNRLKLYISAMTGEVLEAR
jgi:uncharacterized membrane protein YkoI